MLHTLVRSYDRKGAERRKLCDDLFAGGAASHFSVVGGKSLPVDSRSRDKRVFTGYYTDELLMR